MYPLVYFHHFGQLVGAGDNDEVFLAMPFSERFSMIRSEVFEPAIKDVGLNPSAADTSRSGDSITAEILRRVARARVVPVDVSPDRGGVPNANVMYELGLAHSLRLPECVVVVSSVDQGALPFDVRAIRVHRYAGDRDVARRQVGAMLAEALRESQTVADVLVEAAWKSLDPLCRHLLSTEWNCETSLRPSKAGDPAFTPGRFEYPVGNVSMSGWGGEEIRRAFERLQQLGIAEPVAANSIAGARSLPENLEYRITALGRAVAARFVPVDQSDSI